MDDSRRRAIRFLEKEIKTYLALSLFLSKKCIKADMRVGAKKVIISPSLYTERMKEAKQFGALRSQRRLRPRATLAEPGCQRVRVRPRRARALYFGYHRPSGRQPGSFHPISQAAREVRQFRQVRAGPHRASEDGVRIRHG